LYYINSEELLVVLDELKYSDAGEITSLTKDTIKVNGSGTFDLDGEYSVFYIGSSNMKAGDIEDIDKSKDTAVVTTYAMHTYIFVYQDDLIESLDPEIAELLYYLEDAIEDALDCDEALYTQESFAALMKKVTAAKKLNYNSSKTKLKNAVIDIEDAIADLDDDISKNEKKIVSLKKELRAYVNDECADVIEDEFDYTDDSYEYFEDMYYEALDVLAMSDALLAEVEDAFDELMEAVEDLEEVD
jgi:RNA processing factor Prp31